MCVHSRCDAVRRSRRVRSRAASTKTLATSLVHLPGQKPSSNRVATVNALRCCLRLEAHPQARSPSIARAPQRTRRVHTCGHRPEPAPARQADGPTTTTGHRVRCVSVACVSASASPPTLQAERAARRAAATLTISTSFLIFLVISCLQGMANRDIVRNFEAFRAHPVLPEVLLFRLPGPLSR